MRLARSLVLFASLAACFNPWEAYEDPKYSGSGSGKALPEPSLSKLVNGMILQTYYVAAGERDRFAVRRCVHKDGLPERCEVTVVGKRTVLARIPTYESGPEEWAEQGEGAEDAVEDAIEDKLGERRVALTRLGIFGAKTPDEGVIGARLEDGQIKLVIEHSGGRPEVLLSVDAPPGVSVVSESYRSERAPNLFAFTLSGPEDHRDRNNGFVAFKRLGPRVYELVAWLPPIEPNPDRKPPITASPAPSAPVAPAAAPAIPVPDSRSYTNANFRLETSVASSRADDGNPTWRAQLQVRRPAGDDVKLELEKSVQVGCQNASVIVEGVPALGDPRLAMVNFFCEQGEDYFSRKIVTALVFVAEPPTILWEGVGSYSNEMGQCETIDVPFFDRAASGVVRAMRQRQVLHHPPETAGTPRMKCVPSKRNDRQIVQIAIPGASK